MQSPSAADGTVVDFAVMLPQCKHVVVKPIWYPLLKTFHSFVIIIWCKAQPPMVVMTSGNPTCQWIMTSNGRGQVFHSEPHCKVPSALQLFSALKSSVKSFLQCCRPVQLNRTQFLTPFCPESYKIITRIAGFSCVREGPFMQIGMLSRQVYGVIKFGRRLC